jgi:hypothetical protein
MDEMGHQEWADHQKKICSVSSAHGESHVYFPAPRTRNAITLVGCIGVDGSFLQSLIVISIATYDSNLGLTGFTDEKVVV